MNTVIEILPFFALGALGIATLVVASGALRSALRAEKQGEDRFELLRDQQGRLELLREERRVLTEELEREGRLHNHRERQRLSEELERERSARSQDQRDIERLERELRELDWLLEEIQEPRKASRKGFWGTLSRRNKR